MWTIIIGIVLYLFSLASVWFFGWMRGMEDKEAEARDGWIEVDGVQYQLLSWRGREQGIPRRPKSEIINAKS